MTMQRCHLIHSYNRKNNFHRDQQKQRFNACHKVYPSHLPHCGDTLYVPEFHYNVTVLSEVAPRSHMIQTSTERVKGIEGS